MAQQKVRACYDFDAQPGSGELSMKENEILTVLRDNVEGGWMEGRNAKGQIGLFPQSYVVKVTGVSLLLFYLFLRGFLNSQILFSKTNSILSKYPIEKFSSESIRAQFWFLEIPRL